MAFGPPGTGTKKENKKEKIENKNRDPGVCLVQILLVSPQKRVIQRIRCQGPSLRVLPSLGPVGIPLESKEENPRTGKEP